MVRECMDPRGTPVTARRRFQDPAPNGYVSPTMQPQIPRATVARLPRYLRYLETVADSLPTVSSEDIADGAGATAAQVRKDLSHLGTLGTRGVGYDPAALRDLLARALGLSGSLRVALVGAGNLGSALANYGGFASRGFEIVALYDVDPDLIGTSIHDVDVRPLRQLVEDSTEEPFAVGIIATPAHAAQEVADLLVEAGVGSILNFAPTMVRTKDDTAVRQVDLATELQILAYYRHR